MAQKKEDERVAETVAATLPEAPAVASVKHVNYRTGFWIMVAVAGSLFLGVAATSSLLVFDKLHFGNRARDATGHHTLRGTSRVHLPQTTQPNT